jgi:predicted flap endonuclease-1-like 5' DNA nuclease
MRTRAFTVALVVFAAAGGVVAWQRKHETPPVAPGPRPAEPFMDPVPPRPLVPAADAPDAATLDPAGSDPAPAPTAPLPEPPMRSARVASAPVRPADAAVDAGPVGPADAAPTDDLTRISGIGPTIQRLLHEQGITTFAQLAALDDAQVDELQATLHGFPGRIRRDDWVGQAARLLEG